MQKRNLFLCLLAWVSTCGALFAQDDPVLFTVADIKVPVSEFKYIYTKNNRDNADYSRASVTEYLDLYTRFKLKVKKARDLQLDTITSLKTELAGYRAQLAKSYLNDKEVIDKLTRQAYDRMHWDLHVAHILFKLPPNPTDDAIAQAEEKAQHALARIQAGEDFAKVAKEVSEDKESAKNGGDLGYLTCMLPNGFYAVENAIYALKDGEVSEPVQSKLGIHLFKVLDRRPARGEIEAAHILVRVKSDSSNEATAKQKIDAIYQNLTRGGGNFDELASTVSDDQKTNRRGGYIGRFGINTYDPAFENVAFSLKSPGDITKPVRTRAGWHIIKLVKRYELGSYDDEKARIQAKISRDDRVQIARRAMIDKIRLESGLTEHPAARDTFIARLPEAFLTFQWAPDNTPVTLVSFSDGTVKTTADFIAYLRTKTRERMRAAKTASPQSVAEVLYKDWLDELCLQYEEARLETKYPDFKALMREYEEGILLFEVTKMMVWDKASQDTAGLRAFFETHRDNYMWPERAEVTTITVDNDPAGKLTAKARKLLTKFPVETVVEKLNKKGQKVSFERKRYTKEDMEKEGLPWTQGATTETTVDTVSGKRTFRMVSTLLPPQHKELDEARGYVIADYQDFLEKQWVESLRQQYPVHVNEDVLNSIIRD